MEDSGKATDISFTLIDKAWPAVTICASINKSKQIPQASLRPESECAHQC